MSLLQCVCMYVSSFVCINASKIIQIKYIYVNAQGEKNTNWGFQIKVDEKNICIQKVPLMHIIQ